MSTTDSPSLRQSLIESLDETTSKRASAVYTAGVTARTIIGDLKAEDLTMDTTSNSHIVSFTSEVPARRLQSQLATLGITSNITGYNGDIRLCIFV